MRAKGCQTQNGTLGGSRHRVTGVDDVFICFVHDFKSMGFGVSFTLPLLFYDGGGDGGFHAEMRVSEN